MTTNAESTSGWRNSKKINYYQREATDGKEIFRNKNPKKSNYYQRRIHVGKEGDI